MSQTAVPLTAERLASLGRAVVEARRGAATALDQDWRSSLEAVPRDNQKTIGEQVATLLATVPGGAAGGTGATRQVARDDSPDARKRAASLELKLQTEQHRYAELEKALRTEQANHQEAIQSLSLQQQQIKKLQETRAALLEDVQRVEAQLRRQVNETEQVQLRYDKLKSSRSSIGEQATAQTEQINALKAENKDLRTQLQAALRDSTRQSVEAEAKVEHAESRTAESAFQALWTRMHEELPDIFLETHVPNGQTFERLTETLVALVRAFATLEAHVHHMLRELRQVSEEDDKLTRFYIILTKNPGLVDTLRDFLASGRGRGNFVNLLRAVQAWARAFGTGLYKVVVKSPELIGEELNYRNWSLTRGRFETEEAAVGKYFKETAQGSIPGKLGTRFRKQAGDMAYEDYNTLMRQQR
ncbi:MAG: hypothetical protein PVJ57_14875 [Phycisphaerae bacterium]|jgi:hypothetical protein